MDISSAETLRERGNTMSHQKSQKFSTILILRVVAVIAVVAVGIIAMVAFATTTYTVNVFADGEAIKVETSSRNPEKIVAQTGITLGEDDKIDPTSFRAGYNAEDGNALIVYRAIPVTFYEKGKKIASVNAAGTVADALEKSGIEMDGADTTDIDENTLLTENMKINILRGYAVELIVGGVSTRVDFASGTVRDLLLDANITLGEYDVVKPGLSKKVKRGDTVVVKRVTYETREEEEPIPYGTQTKQSSVLKAGEKRIARHGRDGSMTITYKDKVVDGEVVSSEKIEEQVHSKAVDEVVVEGTRMSTRNVGRINSASAPTNYLKTFHGPATAYTAKAGARTASGAVAKRGLVAVDPKQIPYGSKLYIVADDGSVYGYCIAADTGGFVTNGSGTLVDLYMDSHGECVQWGKRNVTIYVISWGNGKV